MPSELEALVEAQGRKLAAVEAELEQAKAYCKVVVGMLAKIRLSAKHGRLPPPESLMRACDEAIDGAMKAGFEARNASQGMVRDRSGLIVPPQYQVGAAQRRSMGR